MKISDDGLSVFIGSYEADPFIMGGWDKIVADVKQQFHGVDIITFKMPGYTGMASISESLDPIQMAQDMASLGIAVFGSNKKVNIMTSNEMSALIDMVSGMEEN